MQLHFLDAKVAAILKNSPHSWLTLNWTMILRYLDINDFYLSLINWKTTNNHDVCNSIMKFWWISRKENRAILEKQDGGRYRTFSAWHWPLIILYWYPLAMYQVSCFYHKMHDSSQNCYISASLLGIRQKKKIMIMNFPSVAKSAFH